MTSPVQVPLDDDVAVGDDELAAEVLVPLDDVASGDDELVAEPRITVNGLDMMQSTFDRVMAALRGLYPAETGALSDQGAIQRVMARTMIEWVATWEARQAAPPLDQAVQQLTTQIMGQRDAADLKARSDLAADVVLTITT